MMLKENGKLGVCSCKENSINSLIQFAVDLFHWISTSQIKVLIVNLEFDISYGNIYI